MAAAEAAIRTFLIADVRGYTSFTAEHGDEAAATLAARFAIPPVRWSAHCRLRRRGEHLERRDRRTRGPTDRISVRSSTCSSAPTGRASRHRGDDGTVRVFDAETGTQLLVLRGHDFVVSGLSLSPDGSQLASASPDGLVRVWELDLDELIRIARGELTRGLTEEECCQYLHSPCEAA